jgi:thiamine pyrophosphate-dependent acetolactate synthase large subunit-like protein
VLSAPLGVLTVLSAPLGVLTVLSAPLGVLTVLKAPLGILTVLSAGVAAAYWAHSPVVCITPEAGSATKGYGGFQVQ